MDWTSIIVAIVSGISFTSIVEVVRWWRGRKSESVKGEAEAVNHASDTIKLSAEVSKIQAEQIKEMITEIGTLQDGQLSLEKTIKELNTRIEDLNQTIKQTLNRAIFAERLLCMDEECDLRNPSIGTYKPRKQ